MPNIYHRDGEAYVAMTETPFDAEDVLQGLIAQHPEILADDSAGQGPLLLVRREAGITDQQDGGARFSLDHLYLDSQGVPTLVEVKRSSDTRGRREVVAQMLDYAANAKLSLASTAWPRGWRRTPRRTAPVVRRRSPTRSALRTPTRLGRWSRRTSTRSDSA